MLKAKEALARAFESGTARLVDAWYALGEDGPSGGSDFLGDEAFCRARYLTPLARLLIGTLRGSVAHEAVYLDERTRYLPSRLDARTRSDLMLHRLEIETKILGKAFASQKLPDSAIRTVLEDVHRKLKTGNGKSSNRILFAGDCIFVETRAFLQQKARDKGIDLEIDHVFFSTTQFALSVDDVLSSIGRSPPDLIGMSLFSFEGIPPYVGLMKDSANLSQPDLEARTAGLIDLLAEAVDKIRQVTDCTILIHNACGLPLTPLMRRVLFLPPLSRSRQNVVDLISSKLCDLVAARKNVLLVDEVRLVARSGGLRAAGKPVFRERDVPRAVFHTSSFGPILAEHYFGVLRDYRTLGKAKALFVDLDNTLWAGVMAEGPVKHNSHGQALLKKLKEAGILLVALSKNTPESVRWAEMLLKRDDFVLEKISWRPKADGAAEAIAELDLAASAFVLLDDNPVERALVTEQIPGVTALDPASPETWRALERWLDFPSTKFTEEARRRTELYREASERRRAMTAGHDYPAMMKSLKLQFGFRPARSSDMERLLELIQRTNQFNTTTKRRSAAEIQNLLVSNEYAVYVASLSDKFGKLGIVAVAIIDRRTVGENVFDSFIMSCRAMGFGLELAFIRKIIDIEPGKRYVGQYLPTERNGPAAELFGNAGFEKTSDTEWVLEPGSGGPSMPSWFEQGD
jgi:FkbH-like protein